MTDDGIPKFKLNIPYVRPYPWWFNYCDGRKKFQKGNRMSTREHYTVESLARAQRAKRRAILRARDVKEGRSVMTIAKRKEIEKRRQARARKDIALEVQELQELCRKQMLTGVERLAKILASPVSQDTVAIAAFRELADRGYGRANQTSITARVDTNGVKNLDQTTLDERISQTLRRVEELTHGEKKKAPRQNKPADVRKYH